jgi:sugar phosphate isomerase/epimerase
MFVLGAITDELSPNLLRALDMACEFGIDQVELHTAWGRTLEYWDDEQINTMRELLQARHLRVCCISSTVFLRCHLVENPAPIAALPGFRSISGSYQDHLEALKRCLHIAEQIEAPIVRIFGFWREGPTLEESYAQAAEKITEAACIAAPYGIKLALENCPHTYFDWGERAERLVAQVDSPWLGLLWDPCSGLRAGEPDYLAAYENIVQSLLHVHAKDILLDDRRKEGRKYVPVLQGQVDWMEIFRRLKTSSYAGVVCLETHHNGPDGTRESAARASFGGLQRAYQSSIR